MRRIVVLGLVATVGAASLLPGCSPTYVLKAGLQQAQILWRRESIADQLADPTLDAERRSALRDVLAVREFAATLGLRIGGNYTSTVVIEREQVVHVVSAAPRFALRPYTWWFPIVGDVPYKGFFSADEARALAADLEGEGYDTYVRPTVAFSTLGWMDDPVPDFLLRGERVDLVETLLHELLHATIYIPGQARFNESFANFVGYHAAIEWYRGQGDLAAATRLEDVWHDQMLASDGVGRMAADLEAAYARGIDLERRNRRFAQWQRRFAAEAWRTDRFASFGTRTWNNAVLVHVLLYQSELRAFEAFHVARGGDLRRTIGDIIEATRTAPDPFAAIRVPEAVAASTATSKGVPAEDAVVPDRSE